MATTTRQIVIIDENDLNTPEKDNKTEIELQYDQIKISNPDTPAYVFDAMYDIATNIQNIQITSNIPAMLIRNVSKYITIIKSDANSGFKIPIQFNTPQSMTDATLQKILQLASHTRIDAIGYIYDANGVFLSYDINNYYHHRTKPTQSITLGSAYMYQFEYPDKYVVSDTIFATSSLPETVMFDSQNTVISKIKHTMSKLDQHNRYYTTGNRALLNLLSTRVSPYNIVANFKLKPRIESTVKMTAVSFPIIAERYHNISTTNRVSFIADVTANDLWSMYKQIRVFGSTHPKVEQAISEHDTKLKKRDAYQMASIVKYNNIYRNAYIRYISYTLFNKREYELTVVEKDTVMTNYNQQIEYQNQIKNNTCDHIKLLESVFNNMNTVGTSRFPISDWERLKEIVPHKTDTDINVCNICELKALCPHYYKLFNYVGDIAGQRVLLLKYVDHGNTDHYSYFCKICGDLLIKNIETVVGKQREGYGAQNVSFDPTEQKIYNNVVSIMRSYVKLNQNTDSKLITQSIINTISKHVLDEERRLLQIKTNNAITIDMTIYVYITVYTYAAIIKLISYYPDLISFNVPSYLKRSTATTGGKQQNQTSVEPIKSESQQSMKIDVRRLQYLLKVALSLILISKRSAMNKITHMSDNDIKNLLIIAYKRVTKFQIKQIKVVQPNHIEFIADTPYYKYLYMKCSKGSIVDTLGISAARLLTIDNPFMEVKLCKPQRYQLVRPNMDYFQFDDTIYEKYVTESFNATMDYVINKKYMKNIGDLISDQDAHIRLYLQLEHKLLINRQMYKYIAYETYFLPFNRYHYVEPHAYYNYCKDGRRHRFNIFIYSQHDSKQASKIHEIAMSDIKKWVYDYSKNKMFVNFTMIDKRCSLCNETELGVKKVIYGKSADLISDEISKTIQTNMDINSFYNYYQNKCPVQIMHRWINDKCEHCKITHNEMDNRDSIVYGKYLKRFIEDRKTDDNKSTNYNERIRSAKTGAELWIARQSTDIKPQELNASTTIKITQVDPKITHKVISNLGLSALYNYKSIKTGKVNPIQRATYSELVDAITRVRGYIYIAIIIYRQIKNGSTLKLTDELKHIYNSIQNTNSLPKINMSFYNSPLYIESFVRGIFTIAKLTDIHRNLITTLSTILMDLLTSTSPSNIPAVTAYIKYVMKIIMDTEKYSSLPNKFKKNIVQNGGSISTEKNYEDINIVNMGELNKDDIDPFSINDVDFDQAEVFTDMEDST